MRYTEKEHKKLKKLSEGNKTNSVVKKSKTVKEESLPAWFNEEQNVSEVTDEDREELDKILNELI